MKTRKTPKQRISVFEQMRKTDKAGNEYWSAKALAKVLGYTQYSLFLPAIDQAKTACMLADQKVEEHFKESFMAQSAPIVKAPITTDVHLSRFGCYLAIQNGDPSLKAVAFAQAYFATQYRLAELSLLQKRNNLKIVRQRRYFLREELAKRNLQLAGAARKAGITKPADYALFQNHGYRGLYGGLDVKGIREFKHLDANQNILDHMDSTELAANLFRVTQTTEKLQRDKVQDIVDADSIHFTVGLKARQAMQDTGIILPENLPVMEDITKLEQKYKKAPSNIRNK